jgi:3-phosphoshikimate 1-carboxyvinyltransferase
MFDLRIERPVAPVHARIPLPRSKSAANRALVIASLVGDLGLVPNPGEGDDTRILLGHLRDRPRRMHCGAGATTFRFLLAWACAQPGEEHLITGDARLLERPHEDLAAALRTVGADIQRTPEGYVVRGRRLAGGTVHFDSPISSQYLSALLLIAPMMRDGLTLRWTGTRLSEPYVRMTLRIMDHFGVFPRLELDGVRVDPGPYVAHPCPIPADWSGAAFWYTVCALSPGSTLLLEGLEDDTLQGDRKTMDLWQPWVETRFTAEGAHITHRQPGERSMDQHIHLLHHPDLFQPLAATHAALGLPAIYSGLDNLRVKETDRLAAMASVLRALGCTVHVEGGTFGLTGKAENVGPFTLDPQGDHRMAMALAPLALVLPAVRVSEPAVVNKSYPGYWDDLRRAGFAVEQH